MRAWLMPHALTCRSGLELPCKALVNEQEYHKLKLLLLVVALTYKTDPNSAPMHHVSVFVGGEKLAKDEGIIQHAIGDTIKWVKGRGGGPQGGIDF